MRKQAEADKRMSECKHDIQLLGNHPAYVLHSSLDTADDSAVTAILIDMFGFSVRSPSSPISQVTHKLAIKMEWTPPVVFFVKHSMCRT